MYSAELFSIIVKLYMYFHSASMLIAIFKMITKYITKQKLFLDFCQECQAASTFKCPALYFESFLCPYRLTGLFVEGFIKRKVGKLFCSAASLRILILLKIRILIQPHFYLC